MRHSNVKNENELNEEQPKTMKQPAWTIVGQKVTTMRKSYYLQIITKAMTNEKVGTEIEKA